ncbi:helix-turn-helix transcriptional regulator [Rhodococcus erythropolis]|uniref:helix-turn-helix domain-containing protein n=1 Tax=Rhodococcus erythropolis TaxID=1833 RepID=UPI0019825ECC|nr:helix-turn-helix transcriptional regulator [Rhodococcus erythropolis]QSE41335.1 helix-turn-helix transcriptional regulator [Rhodococcus erythropolis]
MKMHEHEELLSALHALQIEQNTTDMDKGDMSDEEYVSSLSDVADILWGSAHAAPPLPSDSIAIMLGLVPDRNRLLDGSALKRIRKNARLSTSQLAERLAARGWDVKSGEVFRWETRSAANVPPALIAAIAEETGTTTDHLITSTAINTEEVAIAQIKKTASFDNLVARWAQLKNLTKEIAAASLESRLLATAHRGDHPDSAQMLESLEALVHATERKQGR